MSDKSLMNLTKAESGRMYNDSKGGLFIMELENGTSYREMKRTTDKKDKGKKYPFMRTDFKEWKKVFDMSEFDTDDENGVNISGRKEDMLNAFQLIDAIDSVNLKKQTMVNSVIMDDNLKFKAPSPSKKLSNENYTAVNTNDSSIKNPQTKEVKARATRKEIADAIKNSKTKNVPFAKKISINVILQNQTDTLSVYENWHSTISENDKNNLFVKAVQSSSRKKDILRNATTNIKSLNYIKDKYYLRLNQQFSFALICIVFLFIGAPLGSIIRKGGYGYPLLFAILFYMLFIITTIMGEKLVRGESMNPILAAWLANLIVFPVAVWLTFKALRDSKFEQFHLIDRFFAYFNQKQSET
jgi:lipopolysaccharide export system permease protein